MRSNILRILLINSSLLFAGCSTAPYATFYRDVLGETNHAALPQITPLSGEPVIYRGSDQEADDFKMRQDNFMLVGYSSFNASEVDEQGAIEQAKKVNASAITLYTKYTGTFTGAIPLTLPYTNTYTTNYSGNIYGHGGSAYYSGTAQTTSYDTKTTYIPYEVHRSDYLAKYWAKTKPPIFGIHISPLTPEIKQRIGTNKGVVVAVVIKQSPAFDADILEGDVLLRVGGDPVYDAETLARTLVRHEGKEVEVTGIRGDDVFTKSVRLRSRN